MKYFCLRDDDTSFFTDCRVLKQCYGEIWDCIPITLATIPFIHGSSKKMEEFDPIYSRTSTREPISAKDKKEQYRKLYEWERTADEQSLTEYHTIHPIGENIDLVAELREMVSRGTIEIAQHGVYHRFTCDGAEMISSRITRNNVLDGHAYLEKVFNTKIETFIPPSNTIDEECAHYVHDLGMHLFCSGEIQYVSKRKKIASLIKHPDSLIFNIKRKLLRRKLPFSYSTGIVVFGSITYDPFKNKQQIINRIDSQLNETGFVSLGTHYSLLEKMEEYRRDYFEVVERFRMQKDIIFVTATEYYRQIMEKYMNG